MSKVQFESTHKTQWNENGGVTGWHHHGGPVRKKLYLHQATENAYLVPEREEINISVSK